MLCSWESPFAGGLPGAPNCDYLSRAILPCGGAPITDTAYMGLTSCRRITITGMIAHPRRGALAPQLIQQNTGGPLVLVSSTGGPTGFAGFCPRVG